ncbi:MAG: neuraminidase-like domain-containing protein [Betaproteobacteria bacterium]
MAKKKTKSKGKAGAPGTVSKAKPAASAISKATSSKRQTRSIETGKDSSAKYVVQGSVTHTDKSPAIGFKVIAFDKDIGGEDRLGDALTDKEGRYRIEYSDADFRRSPKESRGADVYVRVFSAGGEQVFETKTKRNASADLVLDVQLPLKKFVVRGQVRLADGTPLAGAVVRGYDKDLRTEKPLGEPTITDKDGRYEIVYTAGQFARAEKSSADLIVRVENPGGGEPTASTIIFNAQPEETIPLVISSDARSLSEFDLLIADIAPVLGMVAPADLTPEDMAFVAGDTAEPLERIRYLATADKLRSRFDGLSSDAFYAWFRVGLTTDPDALFAQDREILNLALTQACDKHIIAEARRANISAWMTTVDFIQARKFDAPTEPGAQTSSGDVVRIAGIKFDSDEIRLRVVGVLQRMGQAPAEKAVEGLIGSGLSRDQATRLVDFQQTVAMTSGHLPLVRALADNGLLSTSSQAALSLDDWRKMLGTPVDGQPVGVPAQLFFNDESDRADLYAELLSDRASAKAPMVAVIEALKTIPEAIFARYGTTQADTLRFFQNNMDFVIGIDRASKLDTAPAEERVRRLDGIALPEETLVAVDVLSRTAALAGLRAKAFELDPAVIPDVVRGSNPLDGFDLPHRRTVDLWKELLEGGITSAADVALISLPGSELLGTIAGVVPPKDVGHATDGVKGRAVQSATVAVWKRIESLSRELGAPAAMRIGAPPVPRVGGGADRNASFGFEDACECTHCSSVVSPAAYFVDLVDFVRDFPMSVAAAEPVLWSIGDKRRREIFHIPLSCENSNTAFPLIDVVNELLEDLVAPASEITIGQIIQLPVGTTAPAGPIGFLPVFAPRWNGTVPPGRSFAPFLLPFEVFADIVSETVSAALRITFASSPNGVNLGEKATVTAVGEGLWLLIDGGDVFEIKGEKGTADYWQIAVKARYRQTGRSSEELSAVPEHWNLAAYQILSSSLHPLPLPFDLAHEEGRAYLNELKLNRAKLIDAMSPTTLAGRSITLAMAREILNVAPVEAQIITGAVGSSAALWGYDGTAVASWTTLVSSVPEFLRRSGLDYIELINLLGTHFVNPDRSSAVVGPANDPLSCKLADLTITGLNAAKLGRAMRFIRLSRRYGWAIFDLDRTLTALGDSDLTESTLESVAIIKTLNDRLRIDLSEMLVWWGNMDTTEYPDASGPGKPTLATLHDRLFRRTRTVRSAAVDSGADQLRRAVLAACGLSTSDLDALSAEGILTAADTLTPDSIPLVSLLFRYGSLARALQVDVPTLLRLSRITGRAPFGDTATTLAFMAGIDRLRTTPFTLGEMEYLLGLPSVASPGPGMTVDAITETLTSLNAAREAIATETQASDDPKGERLRAVLVQLGWPDERAATLRDAATRSNSVPLSLATDLTWAAPSDLQYDDSAHTLSFVGVMHTTRRAELLAAADLPGAVVAKPGATITTAAVAASRTAIKAAIEALYDAPASLIPGGTFDMLVLPVREAALDWLPAALNVPPNLSARLRYDTGARSLTLVGDLSAADRAALATPLAINSTSDPVQYARWTDFNDALDSFAGTTLAQWPELALNQWKPLATLRAIGAGGNPVTTLLEKALNVVRAGKIREATVRAVAMSSGLPVPVISRSADTLAVLESGSILGAGLRPADGAVAILIRWHKVALLANKLMLTGSQIRWLWSQGAAVGFAKLDAIPALSADAHATFDELSSWISFVILRDSIAVWQRPVERALADLSGSQLDAAARLDLVAGATGWSPEDVKAFVPATAFGDVKAAPTLLEQLARAMRLAQGKKVKLQDLIAAARQDLDATTTVRLRSMLQEHLGNKDWLKTAQRIHDDLRERRRDALVAYVINHVTPGNGAPPTMPDGRFDSVDSVFEYLLIDTQVSPCVQTSRIRQATASLQMLIERALAGEETVDPSATLLPGWKWRWETWEKRYRVWEANRKLFLYPENWLDPALRDDRTNEFKALEGDLSRPDLTPDAALAAYERYVREVDQLFHLEVVAFLVEIDSNHQETSHVFARTRSAPRTHYYRRFNRNRGSWQTPAAEWAAKPGIWSAWDKIDLDIPGDHLIPLHLSAGPGTGGETGSNLALVWPVFRKATGPDRRTKEERAAGVAIREEWKIQYHMSRYRNGQWGKDELAIGLDGISDALTIPYHDVRQDERDFNFAWRRYTLRESETTTTDKPRLVMYSRVPDTFSLAAVATNPLLDTMEEANRLRVILHSSGIAVSGRKVSATVYVRIPARLSTSIPYLSTRPSTQLPASYLSFDVISYTDADGKCDFGVSFEDFERMFSRNAAYVRNLLVHDNPALFPYSPYTPTGVVPDQAAQKRYSDTVEALSANAFDVSLFMGISVNVEVPEADLVATPGADAASVNGKIALRRDLPYDAPSELILELDVLTSRWALVGAGMLSTVAQWIPLTLPVSTIESAGSLVVNGPWFRSVDGQGARVVRSSRRHESTYLPGYSPPPREYAVVCHDEVGESELAMVGVGAVGSVPLQPDRMNWNLLIGSTNADSPLADPSLFSAYSPASPYAWEAGFHGPFAIARALSGAGRFEAAQQWLRRIFDPTPATGTTGQPEADRARNCWRFPPFASLVPAATPDADLLAQVNAWLEAPFRPHAVARLRPTAYMRATVMAYLDNLIAWGDRLFERGTPESVDEAVLLYVRAEKILGARPARIPSRAAPVPHSAATLPRTGSAADQIGEYWVAVDALAAGNALPAGQNIVSMLLFCITPNERLLEYWDTVADRLFKIRNCQDIAGRARVLPLFEPPIDPGLLAAAAAAGLNLDDALDDANMDVPAHRFGVLIQKATELCGEIKSLSAELLGALEKKDGEHLTRVRAGHEKAIHNLLLDVKQASLREAGAARDTLEFARTAALRRLNDARMYVARKEIQPAIGDSIEMVSVPSLGLKIQNIDPPDTTLHQLLNPHEFVLGSGEESSPLSGCLMLEEEARELNLLEDARVAQQNAEDFEKLGGYLRYIPNFHAHVEPFGVGLDLEIGGRMFGEIMGVVAQGFHHKANQKNQQSSRHARAGSFLLRQAQWAQQHNQAALELMHIDKQILGVRIREEIAQKDLDVQQRQLDNAEEMESLIRDKFSNQAFYDWMSRELLRLCDQGFALALDVGKKAQRAFRYELGRDDLRFIGGDYWQDGRAGLLAVERLHHDLKRMDVAYLEENRRELELLKHVSLRDRFPEAFFDLVETGACEIELSETLFDADYPGQYMRRLKSVSLSIPCVAGPYTNVNCTLSLQNHRTRRNPASGTAYAEAAGEDGRFSYGFGPMQSIATSTGQNDAGVFEVNFRDERYLPFEGAGAISNWSLELPAAQNRFDLRTVADVILHLKYTARDAGGLLRKGAAQSLNAVMETRAGTLALDLRRDFPDAWFAAQQAAANLRVVLTPRHFPFLPDSAGVVRMFVTDAADGSHEGPRIRGGDSPIAVSSGTVAVTADLVLGGDENDNNVTREVTLSIGHDAIQGQDTNILLIDYARVPRSTQS